MWIMAIKGTKNTHTGGKQQSKVYIKVVIRPT